MTDKNFFPLQTCNSKTIITILEILKFQWQIGILKFNSFKRGR